MTRRASLFVAVLMLAIGSLALGAEVKVEGVLKAVNAKERTLMVEKKTAKGTKEVSLEVAEEAGDLASLKVGDEVSLAYDSTLEVVTKIGRGGSDAPVADGSIRVSFTFNANGECSGRVTSASRSDRPSQETLVRRKLPNGVWESIHTFGAKDDLSALSGPFGQNVNLSFDGSRKGILFTPKHADGWPSKQAVLFYPMRLRLPLTVEVDLTCKSKRGYFGIGPNKWGNANTHPMMEVWTQDAFKTVGLACKWAIISDAQKGTQDIKGLYTKERQAVTDSPAFTVPSPLPVNAEELYVLILGAFAGDDGGNGPVVVTRVGLTAPIVPTLGLAMKQEGNTVVSVGVTEGSPASKAGLQNGDTVVAIDGKTVDTLARAIQLLAMTGYGDTCRVDVDRGGEKKTFLVEAQ